MKVHVFASDVVPLPGLPTSGGGLRSWQMIRGLQKAGFDVTFSMPSFTFLGKKSESAISEEVKSLAWDQRNQHLILGRIAPDIVIWCNPFTFFLDQGYKSDALFVADLHGPVNMEDTLSSRRGIEDSTADLVRRLKHFDCYVTVSERQHYYLAALLCCGGVPLDDISITVVPVSIEASGIENRRFPETLELIYAGGFYPWQNSGGVLEKTAQVLDGRGRLHIFGGPHAGLSSAPIDATLKTLSKMRSVVMHGYVSRQVLIDAYLSCSCALDLMPSNLERELAFTTRTVEYLAYGAPPIYNDYSVLSPMIRQFNAGWCLDPRDLSGLESLVNDLVEHHSELVPVKFKGARNLSSTVLSLEHVMRPLVELCRKPEPRPSRGTHRLRRGRLSGKPRVAVFTDDTGAIRDARVVQPLDVLKRMGRIAGYCVLTDKHIQGPDRFDAYDLIWVQRSVGRQVVSFLQDRVFLYDIDDLLVCSPRYSPVDLGKRAITLSLLNLNGILSVSNSRLAGLLGKYAKGVLPEKVFVTPNGVDFPIAPVAPGVVPRAMIWTSNDFAALTASADAVIKAVDRFSQDHDMPVFLIGRFHSRLAEQQLRNAVSYGTLDFWRHKAFLAAQPSMIAICPLETHDNQETLDFIAGKSDLKMVEYGGFAHPGVYSQSPPYAESDLRVGRVVENTFEAWYEAFDEISREGYRRAAAEALPVRAARNMAKLAADCWWPALEFALLKKPVTAGVIETLIKSHSAKGESPGRGPESVKNKVLLFGASAGGSRVLQSLPPACSCAAFIDNDPAKQGEKYFGRPVISPKEIRNHEFDAIIVSSVHHREIKQQLLQLGVEEWKIEIVDL